MMPVTLPMSTDLRSFILLGVVVKGGQGLFT